MSESPKGVGRPRGRYCLPMTGEPAGVASLAIAYLFASQTSYAATSAAAQLQHYNSWARQATSVRFLAFILVIIFRI
jgi:hypothetical protein